MKRVKKAIGCLAIAIVVFGIVDVGTWLSGHTEAALALLYGASILIAVIAASGWSALLIRAGAEIGVRSQESDNKLDIAQAKVMVEMIRAMRQQPAVPEQPALPMPQQPQHWLPELNEFSEGEFEELSEPTLAERLGGRLNLR